jgi:hypothetical protein
VIDYEAFKEPYTSLKGAYDDHAESEQKIFFDGQIYDAFELLISLVRKVKHMTAFHDRFLILDDTVGYHVGASLKDAGKKCFGISQIQDEQTIQDILNRLSI